MSYTTLTEVPALVAGFKPFKGNSCRAENTGSLYNVYSYNTLVAQYDIIDSEKWVTGLKFSQTTSRLVNLIKQGWGM